MLSVTVKTVRRAYRYRFYPTPEQADLLNRTFGCVRLVWNMALAERMRRYKDEGTSTSYVDTAHWLTGWKQDPGLEFLREVSNVPLQQALRHQQNAFAAFFGKRARYPQFTSKRKNRASASFASNAFRVKDGRLWLAKMDAPLNIRWSRPLPDGAEPTTVTVSRDPAGRWHVSILVEQQIAQYPPTGVATGIDAGLTALATLSDGRKVTNPRHERRDRKRLRKAQRNLARTQKGSKNREKARVKVARVHARITDRRRDHLHKTTTMLVRESQALAIEDLTVQNMLRNHSLARAISDAAWSEFRRMLEYKAEWHGRDILLVNRWYPSSKLCSAAGCAHVAQSMPLGTREWTCPACGTLHDRDINAAKNILAAGLAER
jgi:putative transposase